MADEILEISEKELKNSLINMLLESAVESYSQGSLEDALDYTRAVLARYPDHTEANQLLRSTLKRKSEQESVERLWEENKLSTKIAASRDVDFNAKKAILKTLGLWKE